MWLVSLCVNLGCFTFNGQEYAQHQGLAVGSTFSVVMASLYMESPEEDQFMRILGRGTSWFHYVDDVLVVIPENTNVENKLCRLNNVNGYIQFTVELESDRRLPFLDTLIHRTNGELKFSVYRKPANRDDFVHYLSQLDERMKFGVVIGFFPRAFRICSAEFLQDECEYSRTSI